MPKMEWFKAKNGKKEYVLPKFVEDDLFKTVVYGETIDSIKNRIATLLSEKKSTETENLKMARLQYENKDLKYFFSLSHYTQTIGDRLNYSRTFSKAANYYLASAVLFYLDYLNSGNTHTEQINIAIRKHFNSLINEYFSKIRLTKTKVSLFLDEMFLKLKEYPLNEILKPSVQEIFSEVLLAYLKKEKQDFVYHLTKTELIEKGIISETERSISYLENMASQYERKHNSSSYSKAAGYRKRILDNLCN